ncbi:hypothetical protein [Micrococcus yunnanensis]|nr:hypothetical protein [Micrococcus yunnanensis]
MRRRSACGRGSSCWWGVTYFFVAMIFYSLMTAMAAYAVLRFGAADA